MMRNTSYLRLPILQGMVASLILSSTISLCAADIASLLSDAKDNLQKNQAVEALSFAKEAVRTDGTDYRGHYYVAMAHVALGKFDEAETAARESLRLATEENKPSVEKLIAIITQTKADQNRSASLIQAGDEAFNKGLAAKAADLYRKAFDASPTRGDVGLKAASIYADRLDQMMDAAALWNKIAASGDEASATEAKSKLAQHTNALDQLFKEKSSTPTLANLLPLLEAFPQRPELRLSVAALYARDKDVANTIQHLAEGVKGGITVNKVAATDEFRFLLASAESDTQFETFLSDAFGANLVSRMKEQTRQEQARAAEARRQAAEAKRQREIRERQQQVRAAEERKQKELQEQAARAAQAKQQAEDDFVRRAGGR